jgi:N-acetylglucosaminyldiphosphoundecaprenol N-acetyl-beta-D-mannosaminyltransferase
MQRLNILGVGVSAINIEMAIQAIEDWMVLDSRRYICVTGVHGIMESRRSPVVRRVHNGADLVTPDGMPLVWLLWAHGHTHADRVYGPDLMLAVFNHPHLRRFRHFLYGTTDRTLDRLRLSLRERFPGANIVGAFSPPFRPMSPDETTAANVAINTTAPDIVWVGLSTPKQEVWMAEQRPHLNAKVLIGVGAAFDFHAGMVRQAPRWLQRGGLEWLFRLAVEPRRLGRRYLVNNPSFVANVFLQELHLARFDLQ